jgi:hypothetical protein
MPLIPRSRAPHLVLDDVVPRLNQARRAADDAEEAWRLKIRHRDQLVVQAVDQGCAQRAVADAAGVTVSRVNAILANSQREHEDA